MKIDAGEVYLIERERELGESKGLGPAKLGVARFTDGRVKRDRGD